MIVHFYFSSIRLNAILSLDFRSFMNFLTKILDEFLIFLILTTWISLS
jgi:hypothetical protein